MPLTCNWSFPEGQCPRAFWPTFASESTATKTLALWNTHWHHWTESDFPLFLYWLFWPVWRTSTGRASIFDNLIWFPWNRTELIATREIVANVSRPALIIQLKSESFNWYFPIKWQCDNMNMHLQRIKSLQSLRALVLQLHRAQCFIVCLSIHPHKPLCTTCLIETDTVKD